VAATGIALSLMLALLLVTLSCGYGTSSDGDSGPITVSGNQAAISCKNTSFNPANIVVNKGTTVTWTNDDSFDHTIVADDKSFDSGNLSKGKSFSHEFDQVGTFSYHCSIHSSMKGKITVQ